MFVNMFIWRVKYRRYTYDALTEREKSVWEQDLKTSRQTQDVEALVAGRDPAGQDIIPVLVAAHLGKNIDPVKYGFELLNMEQVGWVIVPREEGEST